MGKDRFDFSEIDAALPAAERMQEEDRVADALENNYKAVRILGANVEKLENRLSEALPRLDGKCKSNILYFPLPDLRTDDLPFGRQPLLQCFRQ